MTGHALPRIYTAPKQQPADTTHRPSISIHVRSIGAPGGRGPRASAGPPSVGGHAITGLHRGARKGPPGPGAWPDPNGPVLTHLAGRLGGFLSLGSLGRTLGYDRLGLGLGLGLVGLGQSLRKHGHVGPGF